MPVFNEERQLPPAVAAVHRFLSSNCRFDFELVIANNGSTDDTGRVADAVAEKWPRVSVVHLREKGRGRALKRVWTESRADIVSYMDVDLSTDLNCFPPLIESVLCGGFDLAVGSRLLKPSLTTRGFKREFTSRGYNLLVKALFRTGFSDAQCGFKALTRKAAAELLPLVEDNNWFMDTELLLLAEARGYRIFDLPVRWVENTDSKVKIMRTAIDDIKGLIRMWRTLRRGRFARNSPGQDGTVTNPITAGEEELRRELY